MRKCELLCLPSFVAHSWLPTYDREAEGVRQKWGGTKTEEEDGEHYGGRTSNKMNEKEIPFVPPSHPLQPPAFSAIRADTGRPAPVAFSCSIAHISNWLGFGLFTYLSYTSRCMCLCTSMGCIRVKRSVIGGYCALTLTPSPKNSHGYPSSLQLTWLELSLMTARFQSWSVTFALQPELLEKNNSFMSDAIIADLQRPTNKGEKKHFH